MRGGAEGERMVSGRAGHPAQPGEGGARGRHQLVCVRGGETAHGHEPSLIARAPRPGFPPRLGWARLLLLSILRPQPVFSEAPARVGAHGAGL